MPQDQERSSTDYYAERKFIMNELSRLDSAVERTAERLGDTVKVKRFEDLEVRVRKCEGALIGLMVRASVWGGLAGLIPIVLWLGLRAIGGGK